MKISKCRNCKGRKIYPLFSLGNMPFTGKFPKKNQKIPKGFINLIICKRCNLVQLDRNFSSNYLYANNYGYSTGINYTMTNHVKKTVELLKSMTKLKSNDAVLDIASNDGTLLNFYGKDFIKVGIDPLVNKYFKYYKKINYKVSDFFSAKEIIKKTKNKFKIITALAVFYDAKDPNQFLKDVDRLLQKNGVFLLEQADLLSMLKFKMFDTICHEHLYYYSTKVIIEMVSKNNLRVFDIKKNKINGGRTQYFISKKDSKYNINYDSINRTLREEKKHKLENKKTFVDFFRKINQLKLKTQRNLNSIILKGKKIHGYGASTKGNVLLQYFNLDKKYIEFIADRNPKKFNHYTPGTKIKIISEKRSRNLGPDYYFVLPWHFKKEILKRENKMRKKGSKFIFPLPNYKIY